MAPPEIGDIQRTFKPGADNLVAGIIISLLLIGGGSAIGYAATKGVIDSRGQLPLWVEKGWCWGAVAMAGAIAVGLVVGGVYLIGWIRSLSSLRVHVGADGFAVSGRDEETSFNWAQIASVTETHLYERSPLVKGPAKLLLPQKKSTSFVIRRDDGGEFALDGNTLREHEAFADIIRSRLEGRGIQWDVVEEHA